MERFRSCQPSSSSFGSSDFYIVGLCLTFLQRLVAARSGSMSHAVIQPVLALDGGCLTRPALLPTVEFGGRSFVRLFRGNHTLMRFLTGKRAKLSPMKDSSVFERLASLRNDASRSSTASADSAAVDGLGLDDEVSTRLSERTLRRKVRRESLVPTSIVEIHVGGQSICVLSGRGRAPVCMEATGPNMCALHHLVSTELSARRLEQSDLAAASEAPNADALELGLADALEPGLLDAQESDSSDPAPCTPEPAGAGFDEDDGTPVKQQFVEKVRGLTWIPKRRAWILRYQDDQGKKRQKRFAATECTRAGQAEALRWLEEYNERRKHALDV